MPEDSKSKISDWINSNKITEIECLVPDMTGNARGKFIPANKFLKQESRLPEGILAQMKSLVKSFMIAIQRMVNLMNFQVEQS